MSKVFSFRLSDDNPREAQAREVIEAWVKEGYSIRFLITDALVAFSQNKDDRAEIEILMEFIRGITQSPANEDSLQSVSKQKSTLTPAFITAVRSSVKSGIGH